MFLANKLWETHCTLPAQHQMPDKVRGTSNFERKFKEPDIFRGEPQLQYIWKTTFALQYLIDAGDETKQSCSYSKHPVTTDPLWQSSV